MSKNIWIICDKRSVADDNGEHFYRYMIHNHKNIKVYFLLDEDSIDYKRLRNEGFDLISIGTKKFDEVYNNANVLISSHLWCDIYRRSKYINKGKKIIFIPHGITLGDSSRYFNKGIFDLCTSCVNGEYESYINGKYNYNANKDSFILTGMPRHDNLIMKSKHYKRGSDRIISFCFTYRKYLNNDNFKLSDYYLKLNHLFNSINMKKLNEKYGIRFQIKFHPYLINKGYDKYFKLPNYITDCRDISYQDFMLNTDIMISDYSSACQEFAVLGRNILYYQFDRNDFFNKKSFHSYDKGWFDWDENSLGKICVNEFELFNSINNIINNNYTVNKLYKDRMTDFFAFSDTNNCDRVYKSIIGLLNKKNDNINNLDKNVCNNVNIIKILNVENNIDEITEIKKSKIEQLKDDIINGKMVKIITKNGFIYKRV